ncbi:hypothetical protein JWG42_10560 [Desulfoprunum benzoelyticum]|uniref:Uncharacterized protein n=1 Tax=Desulfoprunum benzoelyticum TaxID=1506996 RepID=A0A840UU13_9BACT|nr:hypothetical protein [Desulfoprunum benzoelyticum]MBB5349175.1 hypothetical protein [Desulfoprunum benzoelyticum]MBM9530588.1 hypothetical protein [Desulfoprunum benzoelyticum]
MSACVEEHLDNEWFVVRHSGEIPEIALYAARHYLTEAEDGPRLNLSQDQWGRLLDAASVRYREIVLRDLQLDNRDTSIYRGLARSIANYRRFESFCRRHGLDMQDFCREVAAALLIFLAAEAAQVASGDRKSCINCTFTDLNDFACRIGLVSDSLPMSIRRLCPEE